MDVLVRLTVANLRSLVRDRAALFWTFFFPVMFVFLFGWIFSGTSSSSFAVGWADQDQTPQSRAFYEFVAKNVSVFSLQEGSLADEKAAMQKGNVSAVIVIPKGFGERVAAASAAATAGRPDALPPLPLTLYTDPSKQQTSSIIQQTVAQIASGYGSLVTRSAPLLTVAQGSLESQAISNVAYLVPSILAMALMQLGVFAAVPLVEQREKQILKRLGATPLPRGMLVLSNILVRLLVGVIQTVLILGIGIVVFHVQLLGNPLELAGLVLLGTATFLSIGYVLASFARTEETANGLTQVVQMPMMFLSGIFFPFEILPDFLRTIARFIPLTYLGDAMRQVMVSGTPFAPLSFDVAVLVGWLVVCLAISFRTFRWE